MKASKLIVLLTLLLFAFFMISCGGESKSDEEQTNDETVTDMENTDNVTDDTVDDTTDENIDEATDENTDETVAENNDADAAEVVLEYPDDVSSTSNKRGDIAQNLEFYDEKDNKRLLAEWYRNNDKDSKLLWLVFSTYDCKYCNIEKKEIPKIYNQDYVNRGLRMVLIMNGLLAGPQISLEPAKVAQLKDYNLTAYGENADYTAYGYLQKQTQFNKFVTEGYPINLFIDTRTMEIIDYFEGWGESGDDTLTKKYDKFIDFMLDEL